MELQDCRRRWRGCWPARGVAPDDAGVSRSEIEDADARPHAARHGARSKRASAALSAGEGIGILGDYDVDGGCASALLLCFFRQLGLDPPLYIPDRMSEGYGPSLAAMQSLGARRRKL